jgi:8-oxo-dGTP pyrophosphatase MutT (NUDIX family)
VCAIFFYGRAMPMSEYVRRLRDAIGTELLLLPSVAVIVRDEHARVLLVLDAGHGQWGLLGGGVDPGESPQEAAVRECREELGIDVELGDVIGALGGREYEVEYANGDRSAYVTVLFDGRVADGELVPDGVEVLEARWFSEADLASADLHFFARSALRQLGLLGEIAAPLAPGDAGRSPR